MNIKHTLKLEELDLNEFEATKIVNAFKTFANQIGYKEDRISDLECRRRDGFLPNSNNMGGIECVAFRDQECCYFEGTGFKNADKTINEYRDMDIVEFEKSFGPYNNWTEKQSEEFEESRMSDDQSSVLFAMDVMYEGKIGTKHRANIRITVCVKDAPYHRQYDDLISIDLEWRFYKELEEQLLALLDTKQIKAFIDNVEESY